MKPEQTHTLSGTSPPKLNAIEAICDRILAYLKLQAAPSDEAAILHSIRGRRQFKIAALRNLIRAGIVARGGSGKKGNRYLYRLMEVPQIEQGNTVVEEIIL